MSQNGATARVPPSPEVDRLGRSLLAVLVNDLGYIGAPDDSAPLRHVVAWRRAVDALGLDPAELVDLAIRMKRGDADVAIPWREIGP